MAISEEITLRKIEIFLSFMRHGSMSAVADAMNLSTVSVHRAIHSLQEGLRCPLFKKEGRLLIPLAAAYTFAEFAEKSLKECEEGIRRTRMTAGFEATRINIGSAYSLTVKIIPQLIFGLKSRKPHLDVDLKLGSTRELKSRLQEGELDAAIVITTPEDHNPDHVSLTIFEDPLYFAAPLNSKFAGRESIDLKELSSENFVALRPDFITVEAMQELFESAGYQPNIVMRAGNLFSLANLVAEGVGYALLPGRVGLFTTQVQLIPLAAEYSHKQCVRLIVPKAREREPNILALTAECRTLANTFSTPTHVKRGTTPL